MGEVRLHQSSSQKNPEHIGSCISGVLVFLYLDPIRM